jgi:hypothetical protein
MSWHFVTIIGSDNEEDNSNYRCSGILLLAVCSKVTQDNYDKVESGISRAEVEAIIGKATTSKEALGVASCVWGDDNQYIKVKFVADIAAIVSSNGL